MTFSVRKVSSERPARSTVGQKIGAAADVFQRSPIGEPAPSPEAAVKRVRILKRTMIVLLSILCVAIVFAVVAAGVFNLRILSFRSVVFMAGAELPVDEYGHTNILLLGQGDADHAGADLTDTIMVASIDPTKTQSVAMFSIPRDLWIQKTEAMGDGRINGLYQNYKTTLRRTADVDEDTAAQGAMKELAAEIGRKIDMQIHGTIKVDFIGFVNAVDTLGGVDIDVPHDLVDTQYPGPNYSYVTFSVQAGPQHFDGETALKYARSRHSTSDFSRSLRQQQILKALGTKAREQGVLKSPGTIMSLMTIMGEHVDTTFSVRELISLARMGTEINHDRILNTQLTTAGGQPGAFLYTPPREQFGGASVLLPTSWTAIQDFVSITMHQRQPIVDRPQIEIINAGAKSGMGRSLYDELTLYGFEVAKVENAPGGKDAPKEPMSFLSTATQDASLGTFFSQLLRLPFKQSSTHALVTDLQFTADSMSSAKTEDGQPIARLPIVRIILDEDFDFTPITTLLHPQE